MAVILCQKGGAGKTTLAFHLAVAAERAGRRAAIFDPQGSVVLWSDNRPAGRPEVRPCLSRRLERELADGAPELVVLDTAPQALDAALAAASAADLVVIPCRPSLFDLDTVKAGLARIARRARAFGVAPIPGTSPGFRPDIGPVGAQAGRESGREADRLYEESAAAFERSCAAAGDLDTARPRRTVPVAAIRVEDRLRIRLDAEQVARIAEREIGSPIVLRPYRTPEGGRREAGLFALVAGAHRAAQKLGWTAALVVDVPPDEARLVEIDENLARLSALDRARFMAARKEIYERLHPETRHGGARSQVANLATCSGNEVPGDREQAANLPACSGSAAAAFAEDTGRRTGLSPRTVRRAVRIGTELDPEPADALNGMPLADRQRDLERPAGMRPEEQRRIAEGVRTGGEPPKTLDKAVGRAGTGGRAARRGTSGNRRLAARRRAWRMANEAERGAFPDWIGAGRSQAAGAPDMQTGHAREHASIEGRKT